MSQGECILGPVSVSAGMQYSSMVEWAPLWGATDLKLVCYWKRFSPELIDHAIDRPDLKAHLGQMEEERVWVRTRHSFKVNHCLPLWVIAISKEPKCGVLLACRGHKTCDIKQWVISCVLLGGNWILTRGFCHVAEQVFLVLKGTCSHVASLMSCWIPLRLACHRFVSTEFDVWFVNARLEATRIFHVRVQGLHLGTELGIEIIPVQSPWVERLSAECKLVSVPPNKSSGHCSMGTFRRTGNDFCVTNFHTKSLSASKIWECNLICY